jgi:hypothetical protein
MTKGQRERKLVAQAAIVAALLLALLNAFSYWLFDTALNFWVNFVLGLFFLVGAYQAGVQQLATRRQAGLED